MTQHPAFDLEAIRKEIPILGRAIPMNNCSQAPQTHATRYAAKRYLDSWNEVGMDWDLWIEEVDHARAQFARLINAEPEEVAISTSVSHATASVASALDFTGTRRKVVTTRGEFPTVGHVWLAHEKYGTAVNWVPVRDGCIHLEDYDGVVDEDTLMISTCHGYYQTGFKQDLAALSRLAHEHGAYLYVDAYQTLGTGPLDVKALDLDFLAAGNLKFLMGVPGIAFLYVNPKIVDELYPAITGWFGRANPFEFDAAKLDWAPNAHRFDTGTPPVINAYIARAGMEILEQVGLDAVGAWNESLSQRLVEGGRDRGLTLLGTDDVKQKAPTTAFHCPGDSYEVEHRLREQGIIASARGPAIRLAPHFYNTIEDVDRALDVLASTLTGNSA